jgi:quercetin dioxygenase-like cupin family protein
MDFKKIKTQLIEWDKVASAKHDGEKGYNTYKEFRTDEFRIGVGEYSPNYRSAELCEKGHTIYCVEGEMTIQLKTGDKFILKAGNSLVLGKDDHHIGITGNSGARFLL